jgi:hypothetical protein
MDLSLLGVLLGLLLNTLLILATWRVTRFILTSVKDISDSLKAIKVLLEEDKERKR